MKAEERETLADHLTLCSTRGAGFPSKDQGSALLIGLALDDRACYAGSTMEALHIVKLTNKVIGECDLASMIAFELGQSQSVCVCLYVYGYHCVCVIDSLPFRLT
jgi:hypothetical protein